MTKLIKSLKGQEDAEGHDPLRFKKTQHIKERVFSFFLLLLNNLFVHKICELLHCTSGALFGTLVCAFSFVSNPYFVFF